MTTRESPSERRARVAQRRRRRTLGVAAIVDVALRLVDREGVDAVTMRRVAAEFDTGPASLYAHVANRDELLRKVLDKITEDVVVPEGDDWQDVVRRWAHNVRDVMAAHNDIAKLTFAHVPTGPNLLQTVESLLAVMIRGGVPPKVATWSLDVLSLYVSAQVYEGWLSAKRFGDQEHVDEYFAGVHDFFGDSDPADFPYVHENLDVLTSGDEAERFAFGVDMLIAGFAAQAAAMKTSG